MPLIIGAAGLQSGRRRAKGMPCRYGAMLLLLVAILPSACTEPARNTPVALPLGTTTLAPLVERVTPAVVNIAVVHQSPAAENSLPRDPSYRRFFDLPDSALKPSLSVGSGVIVDAERGYVLTNHHGVAGAQGIIVMLKDRRSFRATLVGSDPATDIALLRIEASGLKALPFGDSDALRVGDFVLAIGNPFGLGQTVTGGMVSALDRTGLTDEGYEDFIQTDAAINPGNSGGALVNLQGELIGINTVIVGPAGGNVGIGFAVPSAMAQTVMRQLVRYGTVQRGKLGVTLQELTPELAIRLGLPGSTEGAVIAQVETGSAADRAGLRSGDVVIAANGHTIRSASGLRNQIGLSPIGSMLDLQVVRESRERMVRAEIGPPAR
jgi:serine protease DegQ